MRALAVLSALVAAVWMGACDAPPPEADAGSDAAVDAGVEVDPCEGFVVPARPDVSACAEPDAASPETLVACAYGSGHQGLWAIDGDGLPAYDFAIEQRCDPAGRAWSPRPYVLRDPVHALGNGRGLMGMAHASGGVEIYAQDRGHQWLNRVDTWVDPREPEHPHQIGGGFVYVIVDGEVRSTRFEDLPIGEATARQTRRFGVGYLETVTTWPDLVVTQRVLAPDHDARAMIADVRVESRAGGPLSIAVVELFDVNLHPIPPETATSDLLPGTTARIDRARRHLTDDLEHTVSWDPAARVAEVRTRATVLPAGVDDRLDPAPYDHFPDPLYLAHLAGGDAPDAAWLLDAELWSEGAARPPPDALAGAGDAGARTETVSGAGQPVALAVRVPVSLEAGEATSIVFAFGQAPAGRTVSGDVEALRPIASSLAADTASSWRARLTWAALPGLEHAGAVQRELAWSTYGALASTSHDEYRGARVVGQGGSYRFIHGLDGAIGDLALFADAMLFVDPELSRETLVYAMASQHGSAGSEGAWRYPYATAGVGSYSDVGIYAQRSDAYWLVPSSVGRYVATTRDDAFLGAEIAYWPRSAGERGDVVDHVRRSIEYATDTLGFAARGMPAMGTGDYADGILRLSPEPATPLGSSSTFNALFAALGLPLAADVMRARDAALADEMSAIATTQAALLESEGFEGAFYHRGFADSGNPLAPDYLFVEPQVLPILGDLVDDARRTLLLDLVETRFETPLGAMTTVGGTGGSAAPQVGGVWPVASAWVTEAWARRDAARGWSSFVRNTLFTHATLHPEVWYGVWTGPDSYNGPDHERAGEADAHVGTALTDYPALNVHVHLGPLRALVGLLGARGTAEGLAITPRLPTERWSVRLPRLHLDHAEDRISGAFAASADGPIELRVRLPAALRSVPVLVRADGRETTARVEDEHAIFTLPARANELVPFEIDGG